MQRRAFGLRLFGALGCGPAMVLWMPTATHAQQDNDIGSGATAAAFVNGVVQHLVLPNAEAFAKSAAALATACERWAGRGNTQRAATRQAWRNALLAWARLSALSVGPLVERRSVRRIDFLPTRPAQVEQAIAKQPQSEADMERIGSPAKGFGALEWLLWDTKAPATDAARRYAVVMAKDIAVEAAALATAFAEEAGQARSDEDNQTALAEILNQWIGGAEQLRMQGLERPMHEAQARGRSALPRALSGGAAEEREARWQTLRALVVQPGRGAPSNGAGLIPLDSYLQGKGLNDIAGNLRDAEPKADAALRAAATNQPARMQAAARALAVLKGIAEFDAAPALDVQIGFSDADGD